jgi:hypothetical protein
VVWQNSGLAKQWSGKTVVWQNSGLAKRFRDSHNFASNPFLLMESVTAQAGFPN